MARGLDVRRLKAVGKVYHTILEILLFSGKTELIQDGK